MVSSTSLSSPDVGLLSGAGESADALAASFLAAAAAKLKAGLTVAGGTRGELGDVGGGDPADPDGASEPSPAPLARERAWREL